MPPLYKKKVLAPYRWLIKKVLTPQKNVILKAQTALATSRFSYQLGYVGVVTSLPPPPPPPLPQQTRMCRTNQAHRSSVQIRMCIMSKAHEDVQYENAISSVQMRMCSTNKGHHQVLRKGTTSKSYF